MKKKSTMTASKFNKLSTSQQAKELKKMTKRANVRLSLLEEKDSITLAYRQAYQYNLEKDRETNRFYEGTKYKTSEEIKQAYNAVSNFLGNKSSTLQGIQDNVKNIVNDMVKNNNIDESIIKKMNQQEKRYASKYIAQASNKKLNDLEKNNITQYAYGLADTYNKADGKDKNRFYRGIKFDNDEKMKEQLENMIHFYNAKTSTLQGYNESIQTRLDAFRNKGVEIPKEREYEFFQFLASNEFKKMGARVDSNQTTETFNDARNVGKEVDEINDAFHAFLDGELTFDQVQERLNVAPWQQKTRFRKK